MIKLILNASSFEKAVAVGLGASLDDVLRENLFLTSTKVGCVSMQNRGRFLRLSVLEEGTFLHTSRQNEISLAK